MGRCLLLLLACGAAAAASAAHFAPCDFPDAEGAVQRFSKVLSFKTVSDVTQPGSISDPHQFEALLAYLEAAYPSVWQHLQVERLGVGGYSLLLTWAGSDPALRPALFISHLDVVPVTPETEPDWVHPPFSGAVSDGYIWGRGALDVKNGVVGLLEGAAALLAQGYSPRRTLLLAFGQDEETGGDSGAGKIAGLLAQRGVQLELVWDEGGLVYASGLPPFTSQPVALVATAEKFYQTVGVTLHARGGHASMPPTDSSSMGARLGRLLSGLTAAPPAPRIVSPTREMLAGLLDLAPAWLAPLKILIKLAPRQVEAVLAPLLASLSGATAALVRDTAAMTLVASGVADNVLPQVADVAINFRLLPGTPPAAAVQLVQRWLGPDVAHANITPHVTPFAPSAVTDAAGPAFGLVKAAIQAAWRLNDSSSGASSGSLRPVPVLPYLMPGGTDSKHYQQLTASILRFSPLLLAPDELSMLHGTNERMSVDNFKLLLCTYRAGLKLAGEGLGGGAGDGDGGVAEA